MANAYQIDLPSNIGSSQFQNYNEAFHFPCPIDDFVLSM